MRREARGLRPKVRVEWVVFLAVGQTNAFVAAASGSLACIRHGGRTRNRETRRCRKSSRPYTRAICGFARRHRSALEPFYATPPTSPTPLVPAISTHLATNPRTTTGSDCPTAPRQSGTVRVPRSGSIPANPARVRYPKRSTAFEGKTWRESARREDLHSGVFRAMTSARA